MLTTPDMAGALQDIVTKYWNTDQSIDDAVKAIVSRAEGRLTR
jgi:glucose/mannose transport system substrate-binding protein